MLHTYTRTYENKIHPVGLYPDELQIRRTNTHDSRLFTLAEAEAVSLRPECSYYSNRRIMCGITMITSHTVSIRGVLQNAGMCEQCPWVGHELPDGSELLSVDVGIA